MSRVRELAELIARPKNGRKCCSCEGTGMRRVVIQGTPISGTCHTCAGKGELSGPHRAWEKIDVLEPAAIELAEIILEGTT